MYKNNIWPRHYVNTINLTIFVFNILKLSLHTCIWNKQSLFNHRLTWEIWKRNSFCGRREKIRFLIQLRMSTMIFYPRINKIQKKETEICEFFKYLIYSRVAKQDHAFPYIAASQFPALFVYVLPEKAYDLKQLCGMWYHHTSVVMAEMKLHQI